MFSLSLQLQPKPYSGVLIFFSLEPELFSSALVCGLDFEKDKSSFKTQHRTRHLGD